MFYSQEMTEVELIIPAKNLLAVTDELVGQGVFHQVDTSYMSSETGPDSAYSWQQKSAAYAALEPALIEHLLRVRERLIAADLGEPVATAPWGDDTPTP